MALLQRLPSHGRGLTSGRKDCNSGMKSFPAGRCCMCGARRQRRSGAARPTVVVEAKRAADQGQGNMASFFSPMKRTFRSSVRFMADLRLALAELGSLAFLCCVGSFVDQNQTEEFYRAVYAEPRSLFGLFDWRFILGTGLDHLYTTPYFVGLLGLLGISLTACSFTTQWPRFLAADNWSFIRSRSRIMKLDMAEELPGASISDLGKLLRKHGFKAAGDSGALYATRGLIGKMAPMFVHVSLIITLSGCAASSFGRCEGSAMVPDGVEMPLEEAMRPATPLAEMPPGSKATLRLNNFYIDYYDDGSVAQYHSDFSVLDPKVGEVLRDNLYVNRPIRFGGVTVYQTDWGLSQIQLRVGRNGDSVQDFMPYALPMASLEGSKGIEGKAWGTFLPLTEQNDGGVEGISIIARDMQSVVFYDKEGQFVGIRRPDSGKPIEVNGVQAVVDGVKGSSGIELKHDPGIPVVYAGFGGLIVTTFLSFVSHDQVWAFQEGSSVIIGGRASKFKLPFYRTMDSLLDRVPEYLEGTGDQ